MYWGNGSAMAELDKQTNGDAAPVRSIELPIADDAVVIPGAMLAEVLSFEELERVEDAPDWILGTVLWRGRELPVISLALTSDRRAVDGKQAQRASKLAVVYALAACDELRCYAVACSGVPRPVLASELSVRVCSTAGHVDRLFAGQAVRVDGKHAYIPDIDALEKALLEVEGGWSAASASKAQVSSQ
jgi:chemosensory pili system protein ChpC